VEEVPRRMSEEIRSAAEAQPDDAHTITIGVKRNYDRSGKRLYRAEYPAKVYAAIGRTRAEALGKLLLKTPTPGYLGVRIEDI
jgi:hypothetical protein